VLTPLLDLALPLVGPIIKGRKSALEVAKWLQLSDLPLHQAMWFMKACYSICCVLLGIEEFRELLADNLSTRVIEPQPGTLSTATTTGISNVGS